MSYDPDPTLQQCPFDCGCKFKKGVPIDPNDSELGNFCGSLKCSKKAVRLRRMEAPAAEWEVEQELVEDLVHA